MNSPHRSVNHKSNFGFIRVFNISIYTYTRTSYTHVENDDTPLLISSKIKRIQFINLQFHTSPPLRIPPGLALLIRPLTRITALVFGRLFKRWWAKKTPEEREKLKKWFTSRRQKIYGIFGALMFMLTIFYTMNIEKEPLTGRSRFIILNPDQQNVLEKLTFDVHINTHREFIVPVTHPAYVRLSKITDRLLKANQDLPQVQQRQWTLSVVNSEEMNAYVLPGGNIFVFLGALKMTQNDDQLAIILAHEIAHVLLQHPIEQISRNFIQDILLAVPITLVWAIFPDLLALILQAVGINMLDIFLTLPYSRKLETEADDIGLILAAKACFDVRESVVFWRLMQKLSDLNITPKNIPWLSTHPNHEDREKHLTTKLPEALEIRTKSGCPSINRTTSSWFFNLLSSTNRRA
ncbi:metalloendopeptidase OMA1, mitochondrial-like [Chelonus insularis]|uniref:metalloendopeptidase OMA1, mitochondrial-like n=1 Tax=Chelonus insularis TaxID=460826 RepID=UPI00158D95AB|nr:metalloendopeptidase OMA1, mitochondrial-like [Chelonus insularis]